jgi:hypothetical protein
MAKPKYMYTVPDPDLSARDPQKVGSHTKLPSQYAIMEWHYSRRDEVWGDYDLVWTISPDELATLKAGGGLVLGVDSETGGQLLVYLAKEEFK